MTLNSSARTISLEMKAQNQKSEEVQRTIHHFNQLAVKGLVPMFDQKKQLFCYTLKKTSAGMVREGISQRYTVFTLLGLHRLEENGGISPIEIKCSMDALLANTDWVNNIGDLGLLLWACAVIAPQRLDEVESRLEVKSALTRFRDAGRGHTMELAWFLAG